MHADHHLGLIHILTKRLTTSCVLNDSKSLSLDPIMVVGPSELKHWLDEYIASVEPSLYESYVFKDNRDFIEYTNDAVKPVINPSMKASMRNASDCHSTNCLPIPNLGLHLTTVKVIHCHDAYAIILRSCKDGKSNMGKGWSLVYSGDTIPCKNLIEAGKNCTVLIHEATLGDDMEEDAAKKKHSTFGQALNVAQSMGAYRCILTHFSQRYPNRVHIKNEGKCLGELEDSKLAVSDDINISKEVKYILAYDYLSCKLLDLEWLHSTTPAVNYLFDQLKKIDAEEDIE